MPSLGADMDAGSIVEWHIGVGDVVHRGDIVAVVETDKSDLDVEAFAAGVVAEILVEPGRRVPVGTPLVHLTTTDGASVPAPAEPPPPVPAAPPPPPAAPVGTTAVTSPVLRHLADRLQIELGTVTGSGPGGRIRRQDLERAATAARRPRISPRARRLARIHGIDAGVLAGEGRTVTGDDVLGALGSAPSAPAAPAAPAVPAVPAAPAVPAVPAVPAASAARHDPVRLRRAIAALMTRSWTEIPHYRVGLRIDVHDALARLEARNADLPAARRVLPAARFVHAAARALADVPDLSGWWRDDRFVPGDGIHVGVVVALRGGGLLAPVVHDADAKDLDTVMAELRDLVTRARTGRLRASEVDGATFTVTDLGDTGADSLTPIIHPPQVAILGLGTVHPEVVAVDGLVGVRSVVHATVCGDHRATDGRLASRYLLALSRHLQEPEPCPSTPSPP